MGDKNRMCDGKLRVDPLAILSLALGFFLMIWPTEADMLVSLLRDRNIAGAIALASICFAVVFVLFILSWYRVLNNPRRWRGRGWLIGTAIILVINVPSVILTFYNEFHRY